MNITTFLFVLIYSFCGTIAFAQTGDLVVFTTDGGKLHLALDSKFQNKKAASTVKVTEVPEGNYWVTLYFDNERKAVKSNIKILGNKENSFVVNYEGSAWKLKSYSSVPRNQVNSAVTGTVVSAYTREGVVVDGMNSDKDIKKDQMEQAGDNIVRVHGDRDDIEARAERNRTGQYSGTFSDGEAATASKAPTPKEGTTITKNYIETKNPDGTVTITEEVTTTVRTIVDRNGQAQMRTRSSKALTVTNYTCLPMEASQFDALFEKAKGLDDASRLQLFQKDLNQQCLAPHQIKQLGDLFKDIDMRNIYAQTALPINADPKHFPYDLQDVAMQDVADINEPFPDEESTEAQEARDAAANAAEEAPKIIEDNSKAATASIAEAVVKEAPVVKTKAQIRAEQRLEKIKAREAKKAAKAKARAERKAAKAKAKAARAKK